jgi:F0F1-type ATP synthase membrane subunit b/b'
MDHKYEDWYNCIAQYERTYKEWEGRADKIVKRYRDDSRSRNNPNAKFNILWSNVQTITPAVFARLPRPDVSRRFRDNDPIGRVASMMLERALEYEIEHYGDYASAMKQSVQDRLLGGRGTAWVRYEPHIVGEEGGEANGAPDDGFQVTEDIDEAETEGGIHRENQERIEYECAPVDYVHWRDFGLTVARTWEEVTAVWRKVYMGRPALVERFGEELGGKIPLDTKPETSKTFNEKMGEGASEAVVYEIWDKTTGQVIWLNKSMGKILDTRDDPLQLENFWPCPKPMFSTLTTDSLIPVPDFVLYQDQARQLDTLADRIDGFIQALKVRGVYDASEPSLARLFTEGENNSLLPVKNYGAFSEKGGLVGAINLVDIKPIAEGLNMAYQAMEQVKGQIYEIMGIADIQRGQTDPNETLGAQIIKSNNASGRLKTMQHDVVNFATALLQIKAQIICNHFTDDTIVKISGAMQLSPQDQQLIPQALQLLKDEPAKNFRIEVTTDSMIYQDEQQEKQDRMEFLSAVGGFLSQALPAAQSTPELTPMLVEMLKFGVTAFKAGKGLEGMIDETADKFRQQMKAAEGQPKPPSPEMQKLQMEQQMEQQKMQMQQQIEQAKIQGQIELEKAKQEYQAQENQLKFQLEDQRNREQMQMEMDLEQTKLDTTNNKELLLAYLNNAAKIETTRISSGLDTGEAAYADNVQMANILQDQLGYSDMKNHPLQPAIENMQMSNQQLAQMLSMLLDKLNQPKTVIRGPDGKIAGVQ